MAIFNSKLFVYQNKMEVIPPISPSNCQITPPSHPPWRLRFLGGTPSWFKCRCWFVYNVIMCIIMIIIIIYILYCMIWYDIILCYVMICYILLYYIVLYDIKLYYIILCYVMICYILLYYKIVYYIVLYYIIYTCVCKSCKRNHVPSQHSHSALWCSL